MGRRRGAKREEGGRETGWASEGSVEGREKDEE